MPVCEVVTWLSSASRFKNQGFPIDPDRLDAGIPLESFHGEMLKKPICLSMGGFILLLRKIHTVFLYCFFVSVRKRVAVKFPQSSNLSKRLKIVWNTDSAAIVGRYRYRIARSREVARC